MTTLNSPIEQFNARMQQGNLTGLSYQGLAHLKIWGGDHQDRYRAALMKSTGDLCHQIPQRMLYRQGFWNPIQISTVKDGHTLFLDIKAPGGPELLGVVYDGLTKLVETERLNLTDRASFGFHTTNLVWITSQGARLTPGLDRKTIDRIALYFQKIQKVIDQNRMAKDEELVKILMH